MKKIISLLSAFAMIASMAVSVSATEAPEIKLALNFAETGEKLSDENYDPDLNFEDYYGAPVYKVELSIEGVAKKASVKENGTTVAYTGCIVDAIQTKFAYEAEKDIICVGFSGATGALSNFANVGEFTYSFTTAVSNDMFKTDKAVIGTWYFVAEDMSAIEDMKVTGFPGYAHLGQINQYWDGTSKNVTLENKAFAPTIVAYPATPAGPTAEAMKDGVVVEGGIYDGKTTATTSVFEGASVTSIKVKDSDGKEQTASLPTLLGEGYAKIMTVIVYDAAVMAGKTFNVEYFAGEDVVKTYTYEVPSSN